MDLNTVLLALLVPAVVTLLKWQRDDGRRSIRTEAKVDNLGKEVDGLREWRHSVAQPLQYAQTMHDLARAQSRRLGSAEDSR